MPPPQMRQAGGRSPIECEWCHHPATFVWSNRDPGVVDDNRDVEPYWPIEVKPATPICLRCEEMLDAGQIVEMMNRNINKWVRQFGGEPTDPGWRDKT